jgi:putative transposase
MARRKRIQIPGLIRHVMSRGNGRMDVFLDDLDRRTFVFLLGEIVEEFEVTCWNYCLMSNHYHATLCPTRPNISEAMRQLNGRYAQWWNERHDRVGHVFQGRFKAQIVQRESYLLTLCRYVVMNPVRAHVTDHPADWKWSSYRATVGLAPCPPFLSARSVLHLFGDGELDILQARLREHVLQPHEDEESIIDRLRSNELILGDKAFKAAVRAEAGLMDESAVSASPIEIAPLATL